MIKQIYFFSLFFLPLTVFAQTPDSTKFRNHEINVGYVNVYNLFNINNSQNPSLYQYDDDFLYLDVYNGINRNFGSYITYANYSKPSFGVGYKYHFKTMKGVIPKYHTLRFFTDMSLSNFNLGGTATNGAYDSTIVDIDKMIFRVGYETQRSYKKITFYNGVDLLFQGAWVDYNQKNNNANSPNTENGKILIVGGGICPFIGFKFKINELFSISTETRFKFAMYEFKRTFSGTIEYPTPYSYSGNIISDHYDFRFSPFGLISFNVHLLPKDKIR